MMSNREGIVLRYSNWITRNTLSTFLRGAAAALLVFCSLLVADSAVADTLDTIAVENSVISEGQPDENLMVRPFSNAGVEIAASLLMATSTDQEYILFKFDLSDLPAEATITTPGVFNWTTWYTHSASGDPLGQTQFGEFEFFEITAGDANWEGNQFSDGSVSPGAVTFNNLNGTFTKLNSVIEIDTGEGQPLVSGLLVADGDFSDRQSLGGIPVATLNRLRSGQSIGLAMGSLPSTNFSLHSKDTFLADQNKDPRLVFDFTTDAVFDPADFDEDGDVDAADLATWQSSYGTGDGGDTDLDGDSDGADFLVWQNNLSTPHGGIVGVPEPTTALLFGLALSMMVASPRRGATRA